MDDTSDYSGDIDDTSDYSGDITDISTPSDDTTSNDFLGTLNQITTGANALSGAVQGVSGVIGNIKAVGTQLSGAQVIQPVPYLAGLPATQDLIPPSQHPSWLTQKSIQWGAPVWVIVGGLAALALGALALVGNLFKGGK